MVNVILFFNGNMDNFSSMVKKIKICKYCSHPMNQKPETRLAKNKIVDRKLKELEEKGILNYDKEDKNEC